MNIGDIVLLREYHAGTSRLANSVFVVRDTSSNGDTVRVEQLLPEYGANSQIILPSAGFDKISYTETQIKDGIISVLATGVRTVSLGMNPNYKEKKVVTNNNPNITFDHYKKLFKYIPIANGKSMGFYNESLGTGVYKDTIVDYNPVSGKETPKTKYRFVPMTTGEVVKRFSEACLLQECKFKVINYTNSAKFFSYGTDKKELVGKMVNAFKLELQSKIKRSEELQDTIYIQGANKNLRFLLSDIEIIYPNVKGIYPKKAKHINIGTTVKLVKDNKVTFAKKNDLVIVADIKRIGRNAHPNRDKVYLGFKSEKNNKIVYSDIRKFKFYK